MIQGCVFCGGDANAPDHAARCDGRQGALEARGDLEATDWEDADLSGMVHRDDPHTSREAAAAIHSVRTELHARVLEAFALHGPMTDAELEKLPEFGGYGPSTLRKRRSELYQTSQLVVVGERRNERNCKMLVWALLRQAS